MKKTLKVLSLTLTIVLALTFFSGCESQNEAGLYRDGELVQTWDELIQSCGYTTYGQSGSIETKAYPYHKSYFEKCAGDLILPNGVTSIGDDAFCNCTSLTSITIPDSVTSIGSLAFYNTGYYNNEDNWENNVLYIGNYLIDASYHYYNEDTEEETSFEVFGDYTIKDGTKVIADSAFGNRYSLTSITIPDSVTSIGGRAFSDCTSLTSVTIPNSVTSIGGGAFSRCTSLRSITIPDSVTSIGDYAFSNCTSLTSVTIPNSVTSIGNSAFFNCKLLTSITIPNSVTSIGNSAFGYILDDYFGKYVVKDGFTIRGYTNSEAEIYANENNILFVAE